MPENTAQRSPFHHLLGLMTETEPGDGYIERMEAQGQTEIVNSMITASGAALLMQAVGLLAYTLAKADYDAARMMTLLIPTTTYFMVLAYLTWREQP